jgi:cell wall-associated NlpC family hydrolase
MTERCAVNGIDLANVSAPTNGWPDDIERVPYRHAAGPQAASPVSWLEGSNCQRFAYGVLALFGLQCPLMRSSNLWEDQESTIVVGEPEPLDLVLFNRSEEPYGAHVGVYMDHDKILHLCQEVGTPAMWSFQEFATRPRYSKIVGFKRVLRD